MFSAKPYLLWGLGACLLAAGAGIGMLLPPLARARVAASESAAEVRENRAANVYQFINPLLACNEVASISNPVINDLKKETEHFIVAALRNGDISNAAVYFRDLNNGPWFGINEKEEFLPASLLKVPLMMALYRLAEQNSSFLSRRVLYESGSSGAPQFFTAQNGAEVGKIYSIQELIDSMIINSDNDAALLLTRTVKPEETRSAYVDLGISEPQSTAYQISVKTYASFFRILFNATYLDREFSEKVLRLLSQTVFQEGLRKGIPASVVVAHKFGERDLGNGAVQLHDCGIVYFPNHPYLLCVMTQGKDFPRLASFIAKLSEVLYRRVDKNY